MRGRVVALAVVGVLVAVLVLGQLLLPAAAERRLRADLQRRGSNVVVHVDAFPAIKLLFHQADRVTVSIGAYRAGGEGGSDTSLADLLARTSATGKLDVHVGVLEDRLLRMHDVTLHKDGDALVARVHLARPDVEAALPARLHVAGHALRGGDIAVSGRTRVFGRRLAAKARVLADSRGRVVLRPDGLGLASLLTVPIFADDRVAVDRLSARAVADGFEATARGHLR